jgi:hypothetical protein
MKNTGTTSCAWIVFEKTSGITGKVHMIFGIISRAVIILIRLLWKNILDEGCQINKLIFERCASPAPPAISKNKQASTRLVYVIVI